MSTLAAIGVVLLAAALGGLAVFVWFLAAYARAWR